MVWNSHVNSFRGHAACSELATVFSLSQGASRYQCKYKSGQWRPMRTVLVLPQAMLEHVPYELCTYQTRALKFKICPWTSVRILKQVMWHNLEIFAVAAKIYYRQYVPVAALSQDLEVSCTWYLSSHAMFAYISRAFCNNA